MNDYKKISSMEEIDQIEANKRASQLRHEIEQEAKSDRCLLCGKRVTSFANSHSIPRMILENISIDGKLYWMNSFIRYDEFDLDLGINKAGTFKCICRDCDSKYFQDYEDEDKLNVYPSTKVLAEISVKDYCQMIVKRRIEIALNNKTANMPNGHVFVTNEAKKVKFLDLRDYQNDLKVSKKEVYKNRDHAFKILCWKKLNYVVPIAAQTVLTLHWDLEDRLLNDIHDAPDDAKMQGLHIFVFPLKESSVICAFYHSRDKIYNRLRHQFGNLTDDEKLSWINYWLIANCENYFLSSSIPSEVLNDKNLKALGEENDRMQNFGFKNFFEYYVGIENYTPIKHFEIPNLLSEKYKIR